MSFFVISVLLSAVIGVIIITWIRSFDIYEKETFVAMFLAFFAGGVSSVIIALVIYELLEMAGIDSGLISNAIGSFLVIGPVEEVAKLAGLVIVYNLVRKQFNELTDGIIYMACVALGFSIIENFFYANAGENSQYLLVFRAFISTPAHIAFSVLIGYAWYRYKKENKPFTLVIFALLVASMLHGVFDALAFNPFYNFLLLPYLYLILYQSLKVVQYTNILSPFRPAFISYFNNPSEEQAGDLSCPCCNSTAPKTVFRNNYFTAYRCDNCGYHIASVRDLGRIFRIFAPEYKRFKRKLMPAKLDNNESVLSLYGVAFIDTMRETGFFRLEEMAVRLQAINDSLLTQFRKRSVFSGSLMRRLFE
jgi:RsiW-degrading membrane proteinase PrsW (M82 family)